MARGKLTLRPASALAVATVLHTAPYIVTAQSVAPPECGFSVPADAMRYDFDSPKSLVGDFEIIRVSWQPSPPTVTRGGLHLQAPDSSSKAATAGKSHSPDLTGWYRDSTDWEGTFRATLQGPRLAIGPADPDAAADRYVVTAWSRRGFWGYWSRSYGIAVVVDKATNLVLPDPAGFFCALRVQKLHR